MYNKNVTRFLKRKIVKDVLKNKVITESHITKLTDLFDHYGSPKKIENLLKSIAYFVLYDLNYYKSRYRRLLQTRGTSMYIQFIRYGRNNYLRIFKEQSYSKRKGFKNCIEHWIHKGFDLNDAKKEVIKIQKQRNLKAIEKTKGSSEFTVRSMSYWIKRGYTEEQARVEVKRIQTTNGIKYYINRYGITDGPELYKKRINQWKKTLDDKSKKEKILINLKKSHSIKGGLARGLSLSEATIHYEDFCLSMKRKPTRSISKISQHLFDGLDKLIRGTYYYDFKNYEYLINNFRVDFFHKESGVIIEFYGDFFHRNPKIYESNFKSYGYTSGEKWSYDKNRENIILQSNKVNKIYVVWESEYRTNPDYTIKQCLEQIGHNYVY